MAHYDVLKLYRKVPRAAVAAGLCLLVAMHGLRTWLWNHALVAGRSMSSIEEELEALSVEAEQARTLRDLKLQDLERFKAGLPGAAESRRALYEAGLSLQEEKRLLEKQWEIVSTYILIDEGTQKAHLMRGDQSLESYPIAYPAARVFGPQALAVPSVAAIISKERFAHPERGQSEEVDGKFQWVPPQVGTSVRANALGEFVMFATGKLILHGPPKRESEHEMFPHLCVGLSLRSAQRLYKGGFIGARIYIKAAAPPTPASPVAAKP